jgi:hypothetical protein
MLAKMVAPATAEWPEPASSDRLPVHPAMPQRAYKCVIFVH